jgi:uncharacterized protein YggE
MKPLYALLLLAAAPAFAVNPNDKTPALTVSGRGEVRVDNTVAVVQLGFEAAGPDNAEVRADVSQRSAAVVAALKEEKIERLQTTAINIRPQFDYGQPSANTKRQAPKITGYIGQVTVSFSAPVEEAGQIISSALARGANSVANMSTEPTTDARRAAEDEALQVAAKDAEDQAKALLSALKLEWAGILSINATGQQPEPGPMPRMMMADAAMSASPNLGVEGGETVIIREVTMQVGFRDK